MDRMEKYLHKLSVAVNVYSYALYICDSVLNLCLPEHGEQSPQCVGQLIRKDKYYLSNTILRY